MKFKFSSYNIFIKILIIVISNYLYSVECVETTNSNLNMMAYNTYKREIYNSINNKQNENIAIKDGNKILDVEIYYDDNYENENVTVRLGNYTYCSNRTNSTLFVKGGVDINRKSCGRPYFLKHKA